ncbi:MAG: hypothetical protein ACKVZ6_17395 [Kineosporiaceae bacterium]
MRSSEVPRIEDDPLDGGHGSFDVGRRVPDGVPRGSAQRHHVVAAGTCRTGPRERLVSFSEQVGELPPSTREHLGLVGAQRIVSRRPDTARLFDRT